MNAEYRAKHPLPEIVVAVDADGNAITKPCKECGQVKPLHEFHINDACLHGRAPQCAVCTASARWAPPRPPRYEPPGTKQCSICQQTKPLADYSPTPLGRLGVYAECKPCHGLRYVPNQPDPTIDRATTFKDCTKCGETKALVEFNLAPKSPDGYGYTCRVCDMASSRAWADKNRDRISAHGKRRYAENPEKSRAYGIVWRARNRERLAEAKRIYVSANREKIAANLKAYRLKNLIRDRPKRAADAARRNAAKVMATPKWLNAGHWAEIDGLYFWASIFRGFTVDHALPLRSPKVICGLHAPLNLRVIRARENETKSNKLIPGLERADTGLDLMLVDFCKV